MYYIDLEHRDIAVKQYSKADLDDDMKCFGYSDPMELDDYDWKVFKSETTAVNYLQNYKKVLNSLDNNKICKDRKLPCLLYKRRYIVQTLNGEKNQTFRKYNKMWKKGQLFNLFDQTYFLTVELTNLIAHSNKLYEYRFKLV